MALLILFYAPHFVKLLYTIHALHLYTCAPERSLRCAWFALQQPTSQFVHRPIYMYFKKRDFTSHCMCICLIVFTSLDAPLVHGQTAAGNTPAQTAQTAPPQKPSDLLNPALSQVRQTLAGLNISRWKAPSEVRSAAQQNADSIQRDLSGTLPGLLTQADAAPGSVSTVFPVYRNIDALYDVLLRVAQTADLAAPQNEASDVASALSKLESARTDLGNAVLSASKSNEAEVVSLRAAAAKAAAAPPPAPAKATVVNDGPAKTTQTAKRKKKPVTPASATGTQPAAAQPQ